MARTIDQVLDEIRDWDSPAEEFRKRAIKGKPSSSCACPFAVFLKQETGVDVEVSQYDVTVVSEDNPLELKMFWNPENMTEFIEDFDSGEYPDLVVQADDR